MGTCQNYDLLTYVLKVYRIVDKGMDFDIKTDMDSSLLFYL